MLGADAQAQGRATFEGAVFEFQHGTALAITESGTGRLFNVDLRSAGTLAPTGDPLLRLLAAPVPSWPEAAPPTATSSSNMTDCNRTASLIV